ncbi:hypothetical protein EAP65_23780 [Salmonella enterica]|nr:hypothetical protein [Salmonella enterica]EAP2788757.1 hypothetical protein [Salmonella enterica]MIH92572.1 hypothetical protein [Salmonella enterica subsp. arizonae]MLW68653.1 hypothetical protein [Salmonella enterica]
MEGAQGNFGISKHSSSSSLHNVTNIIASFHKIDKKRKISAVRIRKVELSTAESGVSLDIGNYCTVSLFFEQATLSQ